MKFEIELTNGFYEVRFTGDAVYEKFEELKNVDTSKLDKKLEEGKITQAEYNSMK